MIVSVDEDDLVMICWYNLPTFDLAPAGVPELRVVELVVEGDVPLESGGRPLAPMAVAMVTVSEMLLRALQTHKRDQKFFVGQSRRVVWLLGKAAWVIQREIVPGCLKQLVLENAGVKRALTCYIYRHR